MLKLDLAHFEQAMLTARLNYEPWPWAYLDTALSHADAEALSLEYPAHLLVDFPAPLLAVRNQPREGDGPYRHKTGRLSPRSTGLSPRWRQFVEFLHSGHYFALVKQLTDCYLSGCHLDVFVWEYGWLDWMGSHVDLPRTHVSQLFYFTDGWTEDDGGCLCILTTRDSDRPYRRLAPRAGASSIVCRTEQSWHAVEPVTRPGCVRRSVIAIFRES